MSEQKESIDSAEFRELASRLAWAITLDEPYTTHFQALVAHIDNKLWSKPCTS